MSQNTWTVSQLVSELKNIVERGFRYFSLTGEITQISHSHSGHYYFSLSDERSSISCALFKMDVRFNPIISQLKEGDLIEVEGSISLYAKRTSLQVIVKKISKKDHKGLLAQRFEKIKQALFKEGLFEVEHKKKIPLNPKKIALITSASGAAYGDFFKIMNENCFEYDVTFFPCLVQGDKAPASLIKSLDLIESSSDNFDVIVMTRGGGSQEDLWCFNDESLARRIFKCKIALISAVGHEMNTSMSDYVSDLRCSTPSDAAKSLSVYQREQLLRFKNLRQKLANQKVQLESKIKTYQKSYSPKIFSQHLFQKLKLNKMKLERFSENDFFSTLGIYDYQVELDRLRENTLRAVNEEVEKTKNRLSKIKLMQSSLNPYSVLNRGYTYVCSDDKILENKVEFLSHQEKNYQ